MFRQKKNNETYKLKKSNENKNFFLAIITLCAYKISVFIFNLIVAFIEALLNDPVNTNEYTSGLASTSNANNSVGGGGSGECDEIIANGDYQNDLCRAMPSSMKQVSFFSKFF